VRFSETPLAGAWVIEPEPVEDERGHFARTFDSDEWSARGMDPAVVQANASFNRRAGTLRGLHLQAEPHAEPKLVRCVRGSVFDVVVDLRPGSPTRARWFGVVLRAEAGTALYVPPGLAHGFQTLEDATELHYLMGRAFVPGAATGVRWDDPAFAVDWPPAPPGGRILSERDATYPDWEG